MKLDAIASKQGAAVAVALGLLGALTWLVHEVIGGIGRDVEFLIRLVDTTCGK